MPLPLPVLLTVRHVGRGSSPIRDCRWEVYRIGLSPPGHPPSAWLWRHNDDPTGRWQPTWSVARDNGKKAAKKYNLYEGLAHLAFLAYRPDWGYNFGYATSLSVCKGAALLAGDTPTFVVLDYYTEVLGIDLLGRGMSA